MQSSYTDPSSPQAEGGAARWFGSKAPLWRYVIALSFVFLLTVFLHFREVKMEVLEIGSTSKQYIIAQIDFDYPDEESTFVLKHQAMQDIGAIYKFDDRQLKKCVADFEDFLIQNPSWRDTLAEATYETLYEGSDVLEEFLSAARLTDQRTLQKMKQLKTSTEHFYVIPHIERKVSLIPETFWADAKEEVLPQKSYDEKTASFILNFFEKQPWQLEQDTSAEKKLKYEAQQMVPEQYRRVAAGTHVIDPGEKVTERHIYMLQAMKNALGDSRNLWNPLSMVGSFIFSFIITVLLGLYLRIYHSDVMQSTRRLLLLFLVLTLTLALSKGAEYLLLHKGLNLVEVARFPIIVPFASVLLCVLLGTRISLVCSIFLCFVIGITLAVDHDHFLILNLITSLSAVTFARSLHKRKDIFEVFAKTWLTALPVLLAFNLIEGTLLDVNLLSDFLCTFVFVTVSALLCVSLLPLFEMLFKVMTDMTLMEYMDPNNELLRRLSIEAPGTYQHCLVMGNIAEAAARAIGANDLFCRAATLYHDIGKLFNPHYFTENQLGGFNIHQLLTPLESAHVIMAHVTEGEALAKKHRLPQSFIDIIREHHGTTLVYFFYCRQIEQTEGGAAKVNEKLFRYAGPKPRSKESAIIMLCDTVEAASRSVEDATEDALSQMVHRLVQDKAQDGQLDDCRLTFEELGLIKKAIVKALLVTRHVRIKYPTKQ